MTRREEFENKITAIDELFGITRNLKHDVDTDNYFDAPTNSAYMWFKHGWKSAKATSFTLPERMDYDLEGDTVIDSHHNTFADGYNQCLSDVISMNEEYANSVVSDGWIPVSERLPDEDALVVGSDGATKYSSYATFEFFNGKFHLQTDGLDASNYDGGAVIKCCFTVTHWMPLPAAPEVINER